jgi:hypothetical protein
MLIKEDFGLLEQVANQLYDEEDDAQNNLWQKISTNKN